MAANKSAFLITHGSYSDYSVHAAFSSRRKAEAFLAEYGVAFNGDARIEEYPMDVEIPTREMWEVVILPNGDKRLVRNITKEMKSEGGYYFLGAIASPPSWRVRDVKPGQPAGCGVTDASFTVWCHPKDEAHALKIARDAMRGVMAHGLWKHDATGPLS